MPRVAEEDSSTISHIEYTCDRIHDFGDDLYEDLMERDYDLAKDKALKLKELLTDLIESMSDEI
tara:strand:- start:642 stop:833 length:192 start_codon:yes stop_codon:yes gene_type:complete